MPKNALLLLGFAGVALLSGCRCGRDAPRRPPAPPAAPSQAAPTPPAPLPTPPTAATAAVAPPASATATAAPAKAVLSLADGPWLLEAAAQWLDRRFGDGVASQPTLWTREHLATRRVARLAWPADGFTADDPVLQVRFALDAAGSTIVVDGARAIQDDEATDGWQALAVVGALARPATWGRDAWQLEALGAESGESGTTRVRLALPRLRLRAQVRIDLDGRVREVLVGRAAVQVRDDGGLELGFGGRPAAIWRPGGRDVATPRHVLQVRGPATSTDPLEQKLAAALRQRSLMPDGPGELVLDKRADGLTFTAVRVPVLAPLDAVAGPDVAVVTAALAPVQEVLRVRRDDVEDALRALPDGCHVLQVAGLEPGTERAVLVRRSCPP